MDQVVKYLPLVLLTLYSFSILTPSKGLPTSEKNLGSTIDTKDVIEGGNLTVACNVSAQRVVYWTHGTRTVSFNKILNIPIVTRNLNGFYTCVAYNNSNVEGKIRQNLQQEIYTFFLNVLYPAKIIYVKVNTTELQEHDNFTMQVTVEGNPSPTTRFKSLVDGTTWFLKEKEGTFEISIPSVNCTDMGLYELSCTNDLANKSVIENITVLCPPELDPGFPLNRTVKPRVGDNVEITVHVVGFPAPSYQWWHNGTQTFNHTDIADTTVLTLHNIAAENFGQYDLRMKNEAGNSSIIFEIKADGPPDPVTDLHIFSNSTNAAYISFVTGFDYNDTQTFYIMRDLNGNLTDFNRKVKDSPGDNGGKHVSLVIGNLTDSTDYSLAVLSGNSRANASHLPDAVNFSTYGKPKPDPRYPLKTQYKPRLGDRVVLTIHARGKPNPEFYWSHNGKKVNSTDDEYNSSVVLENIDVDSFGTYVLNITNSIGTYTLEYTILADGPPAPVSNLETSSVTNSSVNINFMTGYDYNKTQTFIVERSQNGSMTELKRVNDSFPDRGQKKFSINVTALASNTAYKITVLSENRDGTSSSQASNYINFTTKGLPSPDPTHSVNKTASPRLGADAIFKMYAVGNPRPKFSWWHNNSSLNHTDDGLTTMIKIHDVTKDDFGEYVLNMRNDLGVNNFTFKLVEDGPPDAVTQLNFSKVTWDAVVLSWKAGFDYGNKQTFEVRGTINNNNYTNPEQIDDSSDGKGGMVTYTLKNLESSASYAIYMIAKNSKGTTSKSNTISFTTQAGPEKNKTTAAEYVGYVMGGVGGVVLIIVIIVVISRCRRTGNETNFEELHEEEDPPLQPHHYSYDDAAVPSGS